MDQGSGIFGSTADGAGSASTVYPATGPAPARSPWRLTLVALALMLVIGTALGSWLALRYMDRARDRAAGAMAAATPPAPAAAPLAAVAAATPPAAPAPVPLITPIDAGTMAARMSMIEERLGRISLAADSASGNAAKAEALLVAFAARRALDRGLPLGPMEAQLRLRFGDSQPNAVESILAAAARPVTQEQLLQRLDALRSVLTGDAGRGWLDRLGSGFSRLIVVRRAGAPSEAPSQRLERAQRAIAGARVDDAVVEVEALPGHTSPLAAEWLTDARRYNDARRSLDLIETAAILEPGLRHSDEPPAPPLAPAR